MGYRSVVSCMIRVDRDIPLHSAVPLFKEFIGKVKLTEFCTDWNENDYGWEQCQFVFSVEDVKWYESYPEVDRFEAIWQMAQTIDGLSGRFIRLGEDDEDVESRGFGRDDPWDCMYVVRHIEMESGLQTLGKRSCDAQEQAAQGEPAEGQNTNALSQA